jgi:ser/thr/tyr protein kinase RAD53
MQQSNTAEDYRYIFRQFTGDKLLRGLNAHYDMARELGKGSFATVMKALHRQSGVYYAIKIIHGSKIRGGDDKRMQAFMREITILESISHENICTLKERFYEEGDENIYLVLELVEGGDLLDYIIERDGLGVFYLEQRLNPV